MTKKEALAPYLKISDDHHCWLYEEEAKNAMDKYAKQQAIAFANHIAYNDFKPHDIDTWNGGKHNTHELYDDFFQHQLIEQQNKP